MRLSINCLHIFLQFLRTRLVYILQHLDSNCMGKFFPAHIIRCVISHEIQCHIFSIKLLLLCLNQLQNLHANCCAIWPLLANHIVLSRSAYRTLISSLVLTILLQSVVSLKKKDAFSQSRQNSQAWKACYSGQSGTLPLSVETIL